MHRRTSRLNHVVFVLLGLVLLAAGAFLLGRHFGWFHALPDTERIYSRPEAVWLHENRWVWIVVAIVAGITALLTLRWLLVQARVDRVRTLRVDGDAEQHGRTKLASDVLTDAVEDDIEQVPGVARARVLVIGAADAPELVVRVAANPGADLAEVNRRVVDEALPAARTAMDNAGMPAQVQLVVSGRKPAARVVE